MLLGGLWHGAGWTFVAWGAIHGLALIFHKFFWEWKKINFGNKHATSYLWNICSVILTFIFVSFVWIFFRATSFQNALDIIIGICSNREGIVQPYTWSFFAFVLLVLFHIRQVKQNTNSYPIQDLTTIKGQTIFITLVALTLMLAYVGNTAFIYGNF